MSEKLMQTLKIGGVRYELVDEYARTEIEKLKLITVTPDTTLSIAGASADAAATGAAIRNVKTEVSQTVKDQIIQKNEDYKTYGSDDTPYLGVYTDGSVFGVDENGDTIEMYSSVNHPPYPVTSVTGLTGNVTPTHIKNSSGSMVNAYDAGGIGISSTRSDGSKIILTHEDSKSAEEVTLSYTNAGGSASAGVVFTTLHLPTGSEINMGGSEGQIVAVNANSTLSPNSITVGDIVTRGMFVFDSANQILRITM